MDLKVPYQQQSDAASAYKAVKAGITPKLIESFKIKADLSYDDHGPGMKARGKGFELSFEFTDTHVEVNLSLSLLYRAAKGAILRKVESKLEQVV